jgi:hypothetical protein
VTEILFEVLRVLLSRPSVDAHSAILARTTVRFEQQAEVDVMGQRRERRLRHLLRQLRYLLESR